MMMDLVSGERMLAPRRIDIGKPQTTTRRSVAEDPDHLRGFGRVYQARQISTGQSVALKLLSVREGSESSSGS